MSQYEEKKSPKGYPKGYRYIHNAPDPVFQAPESSEYLNDDYDPNEKPVYLKWYFWDETWTNFLGPYDTEEKARLAFELYTATLNMNDEAVDNQYMENLNINGSDGSHEDELETKSREILLIRFDRLVPTFHAYAIQEPSTGKFLPSHWNERRGYSFDNPEHSFPRLFKTHSAASLAISAWMRGEWKDPIYDYDDEFHHEVPTGLFDPIEVPSRKERYLKVVKVTLSIQND